MNIKQLLSLTFVLCLSMNFVQAQDIHFSQFANAPLSLNPSMTGVMSCDMRITANYRNQWASVLGTNAFVTYAAGFEGRLAAGRNDYVGLGAQLWADKAGTSSFSTIQVAGSASYIKRLGGRGSYENYLSAGLQLGVLQRSVRTMSLLYGTNWNQNNESVDPNLNTNEALLDENITSADFNAGLIWFMALDKDNKSNFHVGMSFSHLNRSNLSFEQGQFEAIYTKYTLHAGAEFRVKRKLALLPGLLFHKQGVSMQTNIGSSVKFDLSKRSRSSQAFEIGLWTRLVNDIDKSLASDAMIVTTAFRHSSHRFGLSYDINVSSLAPATKGNGSFEFAYRYTMCGKSSRRLPCPAFN